MRRVVIYLPQREARDVVGVAKPLGTIVVARQHICGIATAGRPMCWGDNTNGQIGNGLAGIARVAVPVVLKSQPAVLEFYNASIDAWFITADPEEVFALDNGYEGADWIRTGESFASGGSTPTCRFYGSASPGPNEHLNIVDGLECAALRAREFGPGDPRRSSVPGYHFEAFAFLSTPVSADGSCPVGLVPVFRAYNDGAARRLEVRHRITPSRSSIAALVAKGWIDEGTVMCAPPSVDASR